MLPERRVAGGLNAAQGAIVRAPRARRGRMHALRRTGRARLRSERVRRSPSRSRMASVDATRRPSTPLREMTMTPHDPSLRPRSSSHRTPPPPSPGRRRAVPARWSAALLTGALALLCLADATPAQTAARTPGAGHTPADGYSVSGTETGLGPVPLVHWLREGADFTAAGMSTRATVTHMGQPGQTEPFALFVPPIPPGSNLLEILVCWNWLIDGPTPFTDTIEINGQPIVGDRCGTGLPDLCWLKSGGVSYLARLQNAKIVHGGVNIVAKATDKPLGFDPLAYGEGISIVCVYEIPGHPLRLVDGWCGYTSTESDPARTLTARAQLDFTLPYAGGNFHFLCNALDGQQDTPVQPIFGDEFFVNGISVGGTFGGTGAPADAWQGFLGPNGVSDLYDHAEDDPAALGLVGPGDTTMRFESRRQAAGDCVGHSLALVSFEPTLPSAWSTWNAGLPCSNGVTPSLTGSGPLVPGTPFTLALSGGPPLAPAYLVIGLSSLRAPFKGGILGPSPDLITPLALDPSGSLAFSLVWPALPAGTMLWWQYWIADPGNPLGFCASETLKSTSN